MGLPSFRVLHWLALDAVAVLLAYQWALARWAGVALPPEAWGFLAGGIWLAYMADRALDLARHPHLLARMPKHAFLRRHGRVLAAAWGAVLLVLAVAGPRLLEPARLGSGLALAGAALVYVVVASRWIEGSPPLPRRLKRGATVVLLTLAGGWWVPFPDGWAVMVLFAAAAWLDLTLLSSAPAPHRDRRTLELDGVLAGGLLLLGLAAP